MLNPGELVEAIVVKLRSIEELVNEELEGNASLIRPYHYRFPREASVQRAIHDMPNPTLLVVWQGHDPIGSREAEGWQHQFTIFIRCRQLTEDDLITAGYYRINELLTNGLPTLGDGLRMLYTEIHPNCYSMDLPRNHPGVDVEGGDYFRFDFSLTEIGDT